MKSLLASILICLAVHTSAQAQGIAYVVVTLPETGSTNGWNFAPSYMFTGAMLEQLYANRFAAEQIMGSFVTGYTNAAGQDVHVFCDSAQNILGDRVHWSGYVPYLLQQLGPAITDPTCKWGITMDPQAWMTANQIYAKPQEVGAE
jgi:hypothetical protein